MGFISENGIFMKNEFENIFLEESKENTSELDGIFEGNTSKKDIKTEYDDLMGVEEKTPVEKTNVELNVSGIDGIFEANASFTCKTEFDNCLDIKEPEKQNIEINEAKESEEFDCFE